MKWNHLPNAGGIYDQHPKMLDDFAVLFDAEARAELKRQQQRERDLKKKHR